MEKKYVDEKIVSKVTGFSLQTLRNHRHQGRGIPYFKVNRSIKYLLEDVYEFIESKKIKTEN